MQKNMKVIFLIPILFFNQFGFATRVPNERSSSVPHFQQGNYEFKSGDRERCSEGIFEIIKVEDAEYLQLGGRNGFFLENKKEEIKSEDPNEKNCIYKIEQQMSFKTSVTELSYSSKKLCKRKLRRTAKETFFIEPGKISMNSKSTGENPLIYNCYWEIK